MYYDPDIIILGGTPADHATLQWTSDEFGQTYEETDPSNLTIDWTLRPTPDEWILFKGGEDGDRALTATDDLFTVHDHARFMGEIRNVNIADDTIRLSSIDNDRIEFRHSSDDWDQIFALDRNGESDWDLSMFVDGNEQRVFTEADDGDFDAATLGGDPASDYLRESVDATIDGLWDYTTRPRYDGSDLLAASDPYHPNVENDGALITDDAITFNFGTDLGVNDDGDGVTVEYVGSTIPAEVYDDGTEVLANANGIDFLTDIVVNAGENDIAEVGLDLPDDIATHGADQTFTGLVTFDQTIQGDIDGNAATADHAATADDADTVGGTDPDNLARTDTGQTFQGSNSFSQTVDTDISGNAATADHADSADTADSLAGTGASEYANLSEDETVTGRWGIDGNMTMATGVELSFGDSRQMRSRYSSASNAWILEANVGGSQVAIRADESTGEVSMPNGLTVSGSSAATEPWVQSQGYASESWVSNNYFPDSGGLVSGDITSTGEIYAQDGLDTDGPITSNGDYAVLSGTEREIHVSSSQPSGSPGDIWLQPE